MEKDVKLYKTQKSFGKMDKNKAFLKKDDFYNTREGKRKKLLARMFDFHLCKALSITLIFIHFYY